MKRPILPVLLTLVAFPLMAEEAPAPKGDAAERDKRMEEVLKERAAKQERDRVLGQHWLGVGRELKKDNRLEEAADAFRKAADLMPDSPEAQAELQTIQSVMGVLPSRSAEALDELSRAHLASEDQKSVFVQSRIREGQRMMGEQRFAEALQVLREAQETVRWMAFGSPDQERLRAEVNTLTKEAQRHALEEETRLKERQRTQAAIEAQKDYEAMRLQKERRVASLRSQGAEALRGERWLDAEHISAELDDLLPGDSGAANLKALARERRHVSTRYGMAKEYQEEWRNQREAVKEGQVPYGYGPSGSVRFPDDWDKIQHRADSLSQVEQADADPQWKQVLREKLARSVHFKLPDSTFKDAKEYFEKELLHGPIIVDRLAAEKDPQLDEKPVTLESPQDGMSLQSALNFLARNVGLAWTLRDESVVFTTEEGMTEPNVPRDYDVHDLLITTQDFIGPTIGMGGGGGGGAGPGISFDKQADPNEDEKITGESLVELIKEQTNKDVWDKQGANIQPKNGKIFVNAPPATHRQILEILRRLRDNRTLQVMIQARFIQVIDASLEGLGVNWTGLNDTAGGVSAGFENPRGLRTDIRAAVRNTDTASAIGTGVFPRTFNGTLNETPTTVMQIAFLDNFQASALITAVEKSGKGNVLTAPTLLCFNTQRANMVSVTQYAYIQDITAVVQVQAVAYDPEIGYVQTGIVFDVRPVVSADRKYITLELRPTVSELKSIRTVFTSGSVTGAGANGNTQSNIFVEAPIVNMNAIRTTVSIPDGGTLLIGGLTNYDQTHNYAATPFLSKIPFLSALFSAKTDAQNRQSLVILVKAQIIDQREIETERFGKD